MLQGGGVKNELIFALHYYWMAPYEYASSDVHARGAECWYRGYRAATYPSGQQALTTKIFLMDIFANGQNRIYTQASIVSAEGLGTRQLTLCPSSRYDPVEG